MEVVFLPDAEKDLMIWKKSGQKKDLKRITELIKAIISDPYDGIGKPEPLKYDLFGCWSRRITKEHRLVYEVKENRIYIFSLRGHY